MRSAAACSPCGGQRGDLPLGPAVRLRDVQVVPDRRYGRRRRRHQRRHQRRQRPGRRGNVAVSVCPPCCLLLASQSWKRFRAHLLAARWRCQGVRGVEVLPSAILQPSRESGGAMHLELITVVVDEYDAAIDFFVRGLGFDLVEDSPATTNDGRAKRWVVVRPPGATTGILLAARRRRGPAVDRRSTALRPGRLLPAGRRLRGHVRTDDERRRRVRDGAARRAVRPGRRVPRHRRQSMGSLGAGSRPWVVSSRRPMNAHRSPHAKACGVR